MSTLKLYVSILVLASAVVACKKDRIELYGDTEYIYFANPSAQVIEYSFAFNPGVSTDTIPLIVRLIGKPSNQDRQIQMYVESEFTTAAASDFSLPTNIVLRAGQVRDTIPLLVHNSERLSLEKVRLRLAIEPNSFFQVGPTANSYVDVLFSDIIARPNWWTNTVSNNFLGPYSDAKYRLFIEATGISDMSELSENEQRAYAIIFRDFLARGREQGEEYLDEEGNLIQVSPALQ